MALAALAVCIVASADAQTPLLTLDTPNPSYASTFGYSVAMGDVNADGKTDIAVGASNEEVGGNVEQGRAYVFSGANGSLLFTLTTGNPQPYAHFGPSVAMGDVNGDGKADIAVGATGENVGQGRAYIFSGANGSLLRTLNTPNPDAGGYFGWSVAVGDVNGDAKADIAVGAAYESVGDNMEQGRAYVFSGADGSLLFTFNTPNPSYASRFGSSVAVGDVNGDAKADIAVGAALESVGDNAQQGRAYIFSGANGSLLFTFNTPNPSYASTFGWSVAVGDVNGDEKGDIAVGAALESVGDNAQQGRAYIFSGANGSLLRTLNTPNPDASAYFGWSVAVGDVNGDAKADIAVGAAWESVGDNAQQGRAYIFSGANGSLLFTFNTPSPSYASRFGSSVAAGDVNGDAKADIAVGAPYESVGDNAQQGRAYVFSSLPPPPVGGIAELPDVGSDSGWSAGAYAALAGGLAAALLALTAGAWYARRRWLR